MSECQICKPYGVRCVGFGGGVRGSHREVHIPALSQRVMDEKPIEECEVVLELTDSNQMASELINQFKRGAPNDTP